MKFSDQEFLNSLRTGFIDHDISSATRFHPSLLINDPENEIRILTTIERELNLCRQFWFSVAFITTSGVASIINTLKSLEDQGIKGRILASQYQNFTHPEALRRLRKLTNIELRVAVGRNFHAKGFLFDFVHNFGLIIGSSNLTANALSRNVEWNLKISAKSESQLMRQTLSEFGSEFEKGVPVDDEFLHHYTIAFEKARIGRSAEQPSYAPLDKITKTSQAGVSDQYGSYRTDKPALLIEPNGMQKEALKSLEHIRGGGQKKSLLVSATGTGKTYLSAFDAHAYSAKTLLFVVHRNNIAKAAKKSFEKVFGNSRSMGMYSGVSRELDSDFIFCTIQTLSRPEHLQKFDRDHFDYIIIDESHRAGADSYQSILNYFRPKFLLGMTATPERTDGFDIFTLFNHTIAYEIRLHQALAEDMLSPFHYYGVTDFTINGELVDEQTKFNLLASEQRVERILEAAAFYGTDTGEVRGLIFCSRVEECLALAESFSANDVRSIALTGNSTEDERVKAIRRLESDDPSEKLDYIFTVDIFNEGIDIPSVNQVILLRPTQSSIIFVQQVGRGLRKTKGKEYLTIIDFIGNYKNNYLVPIALYGDNTYNKDKLRKLLSDGSSPIPGTSTINFDRISKEKIFSAINSANLMLARDLKKDYQLLKFQLGRIPMMIDYIDYGSRDPFLYVNSKKSYFNFVESQENELEGKIPKKSKFLLEAFSKEINNGKRAEESMLLQSLICEELLDLHGFKKQFRDKYGYLHEPALKSAIHNLNLNFARAKHEGSMLPLSQIYQHQTLQQEGSLLMLDPEFNELLSNAVFKKYLLDCTYYSIRSYDQKFDAKKFYDGFLRYEKYSRKDVFRILGWEINPVAQNVGGYIISNDKTNCPIFITYHKAEDISGSINYEDYFIDNRTFSWMSKSNRKLDSSDVKTIRDHESLGLRIPLFIKKTDDEGQEFYYIGDVEPIQDTFEQTTIENDAGTHLPVVKLHFLLENPVDDAMYQYFSEE
ncbi:DUF3427 domain-containing protein [Pseudomonadota bacterium]